MTWSGRRGRHKVLSRREESGRAAGLSWMFLKAAGFSTMFVGSVFPLPKTSVFAPKELMQGSRGRSQALRAPGVIGRQQETVGSPWDEENWILIRAAHVFANLEKFAVFPSKQLRSGICRGNLPIKDVNKMMKWC